MKKLKKALSLTLALALSLALALPAFAIESNNKSGDDTDWNLSIQGKSDEEILLPSAGYIEQPWSSTRVQDEDLNKMVYDLAKADYTYDFTAQLIGLKRGDTLVLTVESNDVTNIQVRGWSDPNGDGIYATRFCEISDDGYEIWPNLTGSDTVRYDGDNKIDFNYTVKTNGQLKDPIWYMIENGSSGWVDMAVSADDLFQQFGSNTILDIIVYEMGEYGWKRSASWSLLLTDGSQPSAPAEPEQPSAPAEPEQPAAPSGISVTVGDAAVAWTDAAPFIDANSRTMVPLRAVADAMSLTVNWDGDARVASFTDGGKTISFPIDSNTASTSDGGTVEMDTAAVIANERTYAPIRYLAEYFGYTVGWDGATQTVSLTK